MPLHGSHYALLYAQVTSSVPNVSVASRQPGRAVFTPVTAAQLQPIMAAPKGSVYKAAAFQPPLAAPQPALHAAQSVPFSSFEPATAPPRAAIVKRYTEPWTKVQKFVSDDGEISYVNKDGVLLFHNTPRQEGKLAGRARKRAEEEAAVAAGAVRAHSPPLPGAPGQLGTVMVQQSDGSFVYIASDGHPYIDGKWRLRRSNKREPLKVAYEAAAAAVAAKTDVPVVRVEAAV